MADQMKRPAVGELNKKKLKPPTKKVFLGRENPHFQPKMAYFRKNQTMTFSRKNIKISNSRKRLKNISKLER